jgi:hypothetical protein
MDVVKEIGSYGTEDGKPTEEVRITDCGELKGTVFKPLLFMEKTFIMVKPDGA